MINFMADRADPHPGRPTAPPAASQCDSAGADTTPPRTRAERRFARRIVSRLHGDSGATAIEFVIVSVAVLTIIFTAIQAATYFWARSIAVAAAQEGADAQRAYNAAPGSGAQRAYAFIASSGGALTNPHVSVVFGPQQVLVTVTGECLSVIPGFCPVAPIRVTVGGTVERITGS